MVVTTQPKSTSQLRVSVEPEMLRWAAERSGRSIESIRGRFPQLARWETGETRPTFKQLSDFASYTYVRFATLLLRQPPEEQLPLPDFRTVGDLSRSRPSPNLLETIYICQQRQSWYRDYALDRGYGPVNFVGSASLELKSIDVGATLRKQCGFEMSERRQYRKWDDAIDGIVARIEDAGALIMRSSIVGSNTHRPLDPEEFRGFALADPYAPLIFINTADTKSAQMFTLAHELAHLVLGESGVSNASPRRVARSRVEKWCNEVAAELLVPVSELRDQYLNVGSLTEQLIRLSQWFKASTLVLLRRLYDANLLTYAEFEEAYGPERSRVMSLSEAGDGGSFTRSVPLRASRRFTRAIVTDTIEGGTVYRDATRLLGFSSMTAFDTLSQQLGIAS